MFGHGDVDSGAERPIRALGHFENADLVEMFNCVTSLSLRFCCRWAIRLPSFYISQFGLAPGNAKLWLCVVIEGLHDGARHPSHPPSDHKTSGLYII